MKITIDTRDAMKYGLTPAYLMAYMKVKGTEFTMREMMDDLGYSASNVRQHLSLLERYGYIRKFRRNGNRGKAKVIGAEVLV